MNYHQALKIGIIGFGAIGQGIIREIERGNAGQVQVLSVLCRTVSKYKDINLGATLTEDTETFFNKQYDVIIEAAGQDALKEYAPRCLQISNLLITSMGAFTEDSFFEELIKIAKKNQKRIYLSSGALPAVDWMSSVSISDVNYLSIIQSKPVRSWKGTPADDLIDLNSIKEKQCFFEGSARNAASIFKKSSNITAMLALSTIGLDETQVKLVADPNSDQMHTMVEFSSSAGSLKLDWYGAPSKLNPSTSADVPLAVVKFLRNLSSIVHYGA